MIKQEQRYLNCFGEFWTKNELAHNLVENENYNLFYNDDILDTYNDEDVEGFLSQHSNYVEKWINDGFIFKVDVKIENDECKPFNKDLFEENLSKVAFKNRNKFIKAAIDSDLLNSVQYTATNNDYDSIEYNIGFFDENNGITYIVINEDFEILESVNTIDEVKAIIKNDFEFNDLNTDIINDPETDLLIDEKYKILKEKLDKNHNDEIKMVSKSKSKNKMSYRP